MSVNPWVSLFQRVPVNLHDSLALTMANGMEIVIQRILKLDDEFAVLRGRMAGTQDQGRVVILPYAQFLSVSFNRRMTDPEVAAIFGPSTTKYAPTIVLSAADDPDAPLEEGAEEEAHAPPTRAEPVAASAHGANGTANGADKPVMPSKSDLLAKLRARLTENGK